jgi:hypothetical protein
MPVRRKPQKRGKDGAKKFASRVTYVTGPIGIPEVTLGAMKQGAEGTMSITYITGRLRTAAAASEAPDTSDAALIQPIGAGDRHAMRIFSLNTTYTSTGFSCVCEP